MLYNFIVENLFIFIAVCCIAAKPKTAILDVRVSEYRKRWRALRWKLAECGMLYRTGGNGNRPCTPEYGIIAGISTKPNCLFHLSIQIPNP